MNSLCELPKTFLEKLLGKLDFKDVLTLRHVCRDLQTFIDDDTNHAILPETYIETLGIFIKNQSVTLSFESSEDDDILEYKKLEDGSCKKFANGREEILENVDVMNVAMRDLELVLRFQREEITKFTFKVDHDFNGKLEILKKVLATKQTPLKPWILDLTVYKQSAIMAVLPYMDSKVLKTIRIECDRRTDNWKMDKILETEQWKNADTLLMGHHRFTDSLKNLSHFSNATIRVPTVLVEEMKDLKEIFTNSDKFFNFKAEYDNFEADEKFVQLWGEPFVEEPLAINSWHFATSDPKFFLKFQHAPLFQTMQFRRKKIDELPSGVVLLREEE